MKKYIQKMTVGLGMLLLALLLTAPVSAATPKLSAKKATVTVGFTKKLKVTGKGKKKVKWSSSNKKVATVNSKGVVTGKKSGKATITAKVGSQKLTCNVTVKANIFDVEDINWNKEKAVNVESGYSVKASVTKLWYNSEGNLCVYMDIYNATKGKTYPLKSYYIRIKDQNKNVIAEGVYRYSGVRKIKSKKTANNIATEFVNDYGKKVDLRKQDCVYTTIVLFAK